MLHNMKSKMLFDPILKSALDTDWYKITMGAVVFQHFPMVKVTYEFINRKNTPFPEGFAKELRNQINYYCQYNSSLNNEEFKWLLQFKEFPRNYVEWFSSYYPDINEIQIHQIDEKLNISVSGFWYRTIHWEVQLLALVSELYYLMTKQSPKNDWTKLIEKKANNLSGECQWIDFGTRRRYSYDTQDYVVHAMSQYKNNGFLGTSNPHFAMKYNVSPKGTYAHECVMAMQALHGALRSNETWMKLWSEYYQGKYGIALTDTFTTSIFLKSFNHYYAHLFEGLRQDSGDPYKWGEKIINHYDMLKIPIKYKKMVFSDNLTVGSFINISETFKSHFIPIAGIGTHFTNDVGLDPLSIVMKIRTADFGSGPIEVSKLSDDLGKYTGSDNVIQKTKNELCLNEN